MRTPFNHKEVAMIHYTAPRGVVGGVELVMAHHAEGLFKRGYKVHLIYGEGGDLGDPEIVEHEVPLLSPNHPEILELQDELITEGKPTPKFLKVKQAIKSALKPFLSRRVIPIVHNIPSMPFNFAATAAINELVDEINNKIIFWLHDSVLFRDEWRDKIEKFPVTLLHHKNPKIRYVTPTIFRSKQFMALPEPYKIPGVIVVPNGINIEDYIKIDETTKLLMRKLNLTFEDYILLTPVRVTPRKNIELAIEVVNELKHLMGIARAVKLLVTGPPDPQARKLGMTYMDYLKSLIKRRGVEENVIFCHEIISHDREYEGGKIKKWSVADVYNVADLVFIPSKEEGFGLPVIEAGAARRPVFCSRIPPFQELIRDDIEGYMFSLNEEPRSIAFRIYRLFLTDRVESNFNNVIRRFSWETVIDKELIPLL